MIQEEPKEPKLLDYLMSIDFTSSNQPITKPNSLHKIDPNKLNYYQQAIKSIGGQIIAYDYLKFFRVYGFGGIPQLPTYTKDTMDDCFQLNGNIYGKCCEDVEGILEAYTNGVPHIVFSGPTFIANVLKTLLKLAQEEGKNKVYTVGIILIDGQIEDQQDPIKVLIECQSLPMSIVIIGVGDEDFKFMKQFNDVKFFKKQAKIDHDVRDFIQFVSYQDFNKDIEQMSFAVLDQLQKQFMENMKIHNIQPVQRPCQGFGSKLI